MDIVNYITGITRGIEKSLVVDENKAQRLPKTNDVQSKATEEDSKDFSCITKGLTERSLNVTSATTMDSISICDVTSKSRKSIVRFGGRKMFISVDFWDDINIYLRHLENRNSLAANFLDGSSSHVDGRMRQILVDWLVSMQSRFSMLDETLSLAVSILDRALLQMVHGSVTKDNLQLVGASCLFIANKFEEILVPNIQDIVHLAADTFTTKDMLRMEHKILRAIDFRCGIAHSIQFLRAYRYCVSASKNVYDLAKFISEVGLVVYSLAHYKPSVNAAVSLYLAAFVCKFEIPNCAYANVMQMEEKSIAIVARQFIPSVLQLADPNAKLKALKYKYRKSKVISFTADQIRRMQRFSDYVNI